MHVGKDDNGVIKQILIEGCLQDGHKISYLTLVLLYAISLKICIFNIGKEPSMHYGLLYPFLSLNFIVISSLKTISSEKCGKENKRKLKNLSSGEIRVKISFVCLCRNTLLKITCNFQDRFTSIEVNGLIHKNVV